MMKEEKKGNKHDLNLLYSSVKERYEAMGILPKHQIPKANILVDVHRMKQKKIEKEQPIKQKLESIEIKASEKKQLEKYISDRSIKQDQNQRVYFILYNFQCIYLQIEKIHKQMLKILQNYFMLGLVDNHQIQKFMPYLEMKKRIKMDKRKLYHLVNIENQ